MGADQQTSSRLPIQPIGDRLPLLVGLFVAALVYRPQLVGIGPLVPEIQSSLGVSHAMVGLLVTIPVLCFGLFSPLAPILAGRIGALHAISLSVALIGLAGICRAFVPGLTGILIMTLLIGVGMGIGNTLMVVAVKERFADHPLMVTSVYAMGFQISSGVSAALAVPIALWLGGWQSTMLVYSAFTLVVLVAWLALTRGVSHNREIVSFPRLPLHRGVVWLLAVQFGLMGTLYYGINTWVPAAYVEHGSSLEYAGWLGALYNLGMIPGPLLALVAPEQAEIWMLVGGLANGAMFTLAMSLPLEVADSALDVGAAAAMMLFFGYLMTALAPSLLGGVRDLTGNFDLVMLCFPFAAVLFLICASLLSPARLHAHRSAP
jgi:CP family cyanate transporter-like MFS transporter